LLYSIGKDDEKFTQFNKFIEFLIFTTKVVIKKYEEIIMQDFIITLVWPSVLLVLFFPLIYFSALSIRYKEIISRMRIRIVKSKKEFNKQKFIIYKNEIYHITN
jgi:hypothetical protein